jgi:hypothetical protein
MSEFSRCPLSSLEKHTGGAHGTHKSLEGRKSNAGPSREHSGSSVGHWGRDWLHAHLPCSSRSWSPSTATLQRRTPCWLLTATSSPCTASPAVAAERRATEDVSLCSMVSSAARRTGSSSDRTRPSVCQQRRPDFVFREHTVWNVKRFSSVSANTAISVFKMSMVGRLKLLNRSRRRRASKIPLTVHAGIPESRSHALIFTPKNLRTKIPLGIKISDHSWRTKWDFCLSRHVYKSYATWTAVTTRSDGNFFPANTSSIFPENVATTVNY